MSGSSRAFPRCALGFDDRFIRIWDFYLASCEALFRAHAIRDMQLVLGRPFEEPVFVT